MAARLLEHLPRDGAAHAHVGMRCADAAARVRSKVAPHTIAGDALTGRRIFPGDLRPIAFELFRDKLAEPGDHALPISERATRTITVSSGLSTTQALISYEPTLARL